MLTMVASAMGHHLRVQRLLPGLKDCQGHEAVPQQLAVHVKVVTLDLRQHHTSMSMSLFEALLVKVLSDAKYC